jgi:putative transcriptional regulator
MITPIGAPCLLVALPGQQDQNFFQSVLLLADHNPEGAIGFILNRPSSMSLKSMIAADDRDIPSEIPSWFGGPVDTTTGIILHNHRPGSSDTEISPGIYLSSASRSLDELIDAGKQGLSLAQQNERSSILYQFRFLVGYAGWGPGQLDDELRSGAWSICPLDRKFVFDTPWSDLWSQCMDRIGINKNIHIAPSIHPQQSQLLH